MARMLGEGEKGGGEKTTHRRDFPTYVSFFIEIRDAKILDLIEKPSYS